MRLPCQTQHHTRAYTHSRPTQTHSNMAKERLSIILAHQRLADVDIQQLQVRAGRLTNIIVIRRDCRSRKCEERVPLLTEGFSSTYTSSHKTGRCLSVRTEVCQDHTRASCLHKRCVCVRAEGSTVWESLAPRVELREQRFHAGIPSRPACSC